MRDCAGDYMKVFVNGEERPGLIFYGLREYGTSATGDFPLDLWQGVSGLDSLYLYGESWEVVGWEVAVDRWPLRGELDQAVKATLDRLVRASCVVAWVGAEGYPFCDPPELFSPTCMSGGVLAYLTSSGVYKNLIDPMGGLPIEALSDDEMTWLRQQAYPLSAGK